MSAALLASPVATSPTAAVWSVALPLPLPAYDFAALHGSQALPLGRRVLVPWRGDLALGVVVGGGAGSGHKLREVAGVLDEAAWVGKGFLEGVASLSALSRVPTGLLLSDLLGVGLTPRYRHRVRAVQDAELSVFGPHTPTPDWTDASAFAPTLLDAVREQGLLEEDFTLLPRMTSVYRARPWAQVPAEQRVQTAWQALPASPVALTARQQKAWEWLREHGPVSGLSEWGRRAGVGSSVVMAVLQRGWAEPVQLDAQLPHAWEVLRAAGQFETQSAWAQAAGVSGSQVAGVLARRWADSVEVPAPPPALPLPAAAPRPVPDDLPEELVWRLHGGRDRERFVRLAARIRRRLELGRGVLVLAPEAATLRRAWDALSGLAEETGTQAALFSGVLSEVQREHTWQLIQSGAARLVIGSALALPAPIADLALVVVMEEGSDAYKLLSGSGVFVPDLAARMARALQTPLAYVGTVPAVESVPHAGVVLDAPRSRLHIVDYANPAPQPEMGPLSAVQLRGSGSGYPISHDLAKVLRQVAERGRQAVLLAPRRGYSALIRCPACEHTPQCRNCDIPLRLHQHTRQLTCHQCGYAQGIPERCDVCGEMMWSAKGPGTEWIAAEAGTLLSGCPVYRFDKDHQDDLTPLMNGESGVVVGTQALLSQEALPNLALIGITLADTWLNLSDFRASERYHRLLRQLISWHPERAPLLLVQTFQAEHPALRSVVDGLDALSFPSSEYELRRALHYPPHATLAQVLITARDQSRASAGADEVAQALFAAGATSAEVLGPAPSPVTRVRGLYPYHLMLRVRDEARLSALLEALNRSFKARVRVDVTPRGGLGV
ncbi:primosomal protein N' [Deinococcus psychrotolerans]|uniref:Probable replication restart protein PriA n=1 Tax=Deinococcus psychrotolerans TaxID=2489213 RepID=A0A3G8YAG4_9DEIO|nr:primosomal protein N' [Deinococcus psychrotolerans]AZI42145.1 primosomal protein N' [Deinococcus psychrotolerans]